MLSFVVKVSTGCFDSNIMYIDQSNQHLLGLLVLTAGHWGQPVFKQGDRQLQGSRSNIISCTKIARWTLNNNQSINHYTKIISNNAKVISVKDKI